MRRVLVLLTGGTIAGAMRDGKDTAPDAGASERLERLLGELFDSEAFVSSLPFPGEFPTGQLRSEPATLDRAHSNHHRRAAEGRHPGCHHPSRNGYHGLYRSVALSCSRRDSSSRGAHGKSADAGLHARGRTGEPSRRSAGRLRWISRCMGLLQLEADPWETRRTKPGRFTPTRLPPSTDCPFSSAPSGDAKHRRFFCRNCTGILPDLFRIF